MCIRDRAELSQCAAALKLGNDSELPQKLQALVSEGKEKDRKIAELEGKLASGKIKELLEGAVKVEGTSLVVAGMVGVAPDVLRSMIDKAKEQESDLVAVLSVSYTHLDVYKRQAVRRRAQGADHR